MAKHECEFHKLTKRHKIFTKMVYYISSISVERVTVCSLQLQTWGISWNLLKEKEEATTTLNWINKMFISKKVIN